MEKRIKWLFLASVLTMTIVAILPEHYSPSFGQQNPVPTTGREPACGCYNCFTNNPKIPNYVYFDDGKVTAGKPCTGIVAADACPREQMPYLPDKGRAFCEKIKKSWGVTSSKDLCPVYAAACAPFDNPPPEKKCDRPNSPWLGSSPTDCKDFQSWHIAQTRGAVTVSMCGQIIFNNPKVGTDPLFSSAYIAALRDRLRETIGEKVCCDKFREAMRTGMPCDPRKDVDCDGKPNSEDDDRRYQDADSYFPNIDISFKTPRGAAIDPFPPGLNLGEIYPNVESCEGCQWELLKGELKCNVLTPDGKRHVYQAKWRCPSTGVEVDTFKYAPATAPCKK